MHSTQTKKDTKRASITERTASKDNVVSIPSQSLATMMRKRAHLQFSSVKAGNGPIPVGQSASKFMSLRALQPTAVSSPVYASIVTADSARSRNTSSVSPTKSTKDSETSATGAPRTLRAKPSMPRLRDSGKALGTRSPNLPGDAAQDSPRPTTLSKQASRTFNKQEIITQSPIMSAMIRAKTQKTITGGVNTISGNGIKVKGAPVAQLSQEVSDAASPRNIRVKTDQPTTRIKNTYSNLGHPSSVSAINKRGSLYGEVSSSNTKSPGLVRTVML